MCKTIAINHQQCVVWQLAILNGENFVNYAPEKSKLHKTGKVVRRPVYDSIANEFISRNLMYGNKFDMDYDCCLYIHPKALMLSSKRQVDMLDTRCRSTGNLGSILSIGDPNLCAYFNMETTERITSFAASPTRENVS